MSDQFISYNRVPRETIRYWKTFFYHLLEIVTTNCSIIYNWVRMESELKKKSQTEFHDHLVQQIIEKFGKPIVSSESFTMLHGSRFRSDVQKQRCAYCHVQHTLWFCPDCPYEPSLCQVIERDCHSIWHSEESSDYESIGSKIENGTILLRIHPAQAQQERRKDNQKAVRIYEREEDSTIISRI